MMPLIGNTSKPMDVEIAMPKKPTKIVINALHDVLSR